ncbi:MAG TPA: type VI secretion system tip protein VgrG [Pseudomonas sp.]|nr:type VI secretion system tip protein VgrG [Pseudomonas sp.]
MFGLANEPHFSLLIDGAATDLGVVSFTGTEGLSRLYRFEIELVSEQPPQPDALIGKQAFLAFSPQMRGFHGVVVEAGSASTKQRQHYLRIVLMPQLEHLSRRTNQRIFQNQDVASILKTVFNEHGLFGHEFRLYEAHPPRVYCVQYDETDFAFISRLCEEEGIHYFFEHGPGGHALVFTDSQSGFGKLDEPVEFVQDSGLVADHPVIKQFDLSLAIRTNRTARRDYDFEKPHVMLEGSSAGEGTPALEDYDYPGLFDNQGRGKQLSQFALQRHQSDSRLARGWGDHPSLAAGFFFPLQGHPHAELNDLWLITEAQHQGRQSQSLEELGDDLSSDFQPGYRNSFTATPWDLSQRPALKHPKPRVLGSQTAVVSGPPGEEIYCDQYGRVKIQFHWDREGQRDENTSCWVRVASSWAHDSYGTVVIPRIGMEVLVTFLEGDPDQPLITGCLHHAAHPVPYALPEHKTRSVFKSNSSPGGGGSNELRIEDRKDAEQIYIHAQRDQDIEVEHNETHWVGNDRSKTVDHDETVHIGNNRTETVDSNETITIHKNRRKTVDKHETAHIKRNWSVTVDRFKTETVKLAYMQNVGLAKMMNIGTVYSQNVGLHMNTVVGVNQTTNVGKSYNLGVGAASGGESTSEIRMDAESITLQVGKAVMVLKSDGSVLINGTQFNFEASGPVQISGNDIDLN